MALMLMQTWHKADAPKDEGERHCLLREVKRATLSQDGEVLQEHSLLEYLSRQDKDGIVTHRWKLAPTVTVRIIFGYDAKIYITDPDWMSKVESPWI